MTNPIAAAGEAQARAAPDASPRCVKWAIRQARDEMVERIRKLEGRLAGVEFAISCFPDDDVDQTGTGS